MTPRTVKVPMYSLYRSLGTASLRHDTRNAPFGNHGRSLRIGRAVLMDRAVVLALTGALSAMLAASGTVRAAGEGPVRDLHSYGNFHEVRVQHIALNLAIDFARKELRGIATLTVERMPGSPSDAPLILDSRPERAVRHRRGHGPSPRTPVRDRPLRSDPGLAITNCSPQGHHDDLDLLHDAADSICACSGSTRAVRPAASDRSSTRSRRRFRLGLGSPARTLLA